MNKYKIALIPPNGQFKKQDFSLIRINEWLSQYNNLEVILVYIESSQFQKDISSFNHIIKTQTEEDLFRIIHSLNVNLIFHRSWMGAYPFGVKLIQKFDNVIVNIKDWNFASKEVYEFLFKGNNDYSAIENIFKKAKYVLSHFTKDQSSIWAKEYTTSEEKFIYFPEYCNEKNFNNKPYLKYKDIKLVYAGKVPPSCYAEEYFPGKSHLRSIKLLSQQNIKIDFVIPPSLYDEFLSSELFLDFQYENQYNDNFSVKKGSNLKSDILDEYHFGFFELETSGVNFELYEYAVTSKFAFYLEAGLPMLINEKFKSMSQLVQEHQLGIVFSNSDLSNMTDKVKVTQASYDTMVNNVKSFRKEFTYSKQCDLKRLLSHEIA